MPSTLILHSDGSGHIHIFNKYGGLLGIAIVDPEDVDKVMQYKWYISTGGYAFTTFKEGDKRKWVALHRMVLDAPDKYHVDHINRNKLDCRKSNLRLVTPKENNQNRNPKGLLINKKKITSSKYRGVSYDAEKKKWRAQIKVNGKNKSLGWFDSEIAAAVAAKKAREKYFPYSKS